jgi:hypothetical protein
MIPPRNPNQVPPELEDDVGKHNESDFNDPPPADDDDLTEDDEENYRDGDDEE